MEWFLKLKEIDSLTKMRTAELKGKIEQEDRLSKLKSITSERLSSIEELKHALIRLHDTLAELEKKIKTASEQKQRLLDIGGDDKKILSYATDISSWEETGMQILEDEEKLNLELEEHKTFLKGVEKTSREIQKEVNQISEGIDKNVINIDLRLKLLTEELPTSFRSILEKVTAKKLAHGPFTRNEQGSCFFCRYKISKLDESEIDMQQQLKTCPQCSRIFLPYGS